MWSNSILLESASAEIVGLHCTVYRSTIHVLNKCLANCGKEMRNGFLNLLVTDRGRRGWRGLWCTAWFRRSTRQTVFADFNPVRMEANLDPDPLEVRHAYVVSRRVVTTSNCWIAAW